MKTKTSLTTLLELLGVLSMVCLVVPPKISSAQSTSVLHNGVIGATAQVKRGEGIFLQRCALCHLPKAVKPKPQPSTGPSLSTLLKNSTADREKAVRAVILKGTPNMPGFQYGLNTNEIDDVLAYLKSL